MQQFHLIPGQEHNKNRNSDLCTASELVNHISIFFSIFLFNKTYILNYKKKSQNIISVKIPYVFQQLSTMFKKHHIDTIIKKPNLREEMGTF